MNPSNFCLIGIPDHEAVYNVGGRIGAALGPEAFRRVFSRLRGRDGVERAIQWSGNVENLGRDVVKNHQAAAERIEQAHRGGARTVVIGGGHDHGYSHLLGIQRALRASTNGALGCINIDAHLDVRKPEPAITSGSPFFLALENGVLEPSRFVEFGIQSHCNGPELWQYVETKKVKVVPFEELRHGHAVEAFKKELSGLSKKCDSIVLSLDLDAASQADAPGVSAPQSEGFTTSELMEMAELAGANEKVVSLGLFELNPLHDVDDRTARLAATLAYHFMASAITSAQRA